MVFSKTSDKLTNEVSFDDFICTPDGQIRPAKLAWHPDAVGFIYKAQVRINQIHSCDRSLLAIGRALRAIGWPLCDDFAADHQVVVLVRMLRAVGDAIRIYPARTPDGRFKHRAVWRCVPDGLVAKLREFADYRYVSLDHEEALIGDVGSSAALDLALINIARTLAQLLECAEAGW